MDAVHRRLVVVRHAKSAWPMGVPDRRRPLGPRGIADAPRMGARIRALVEGIDLAVISPAERTRQTWELLRDELGDVPDERTDERIYADWGAHMLEVVRELPDEAATVLLLGHEPGVSELVLLLADRSAPLLRERIGAKFPTCAVAVLAGTGPWAGFGPGCAQLQSFTTPKD